MRHRTIAFTCKRAVAAPALTGPEVMNGRAGARGWGEKRAARLAGR